MSCASGRHRIFTTDFFNKRIGIDKRAFSRALFDLHRDKMERMNAKEGGKANAFLEITPQQGLDGSLAFPHERAGTRGTGTKCARSADHGRGEAGEQRPSQPVGAMEDEEQAKKDFMEASNPLITFLKDTEPEGRISRNDLYQKYVDWCQEAGHKQGSRTYFGREIKKVLPEGTQIFDSHSMGDKFRGYIFPENGPW